MITPISKKSPHRVFNWSGYLAGMWVSAVRAGTGAFLAFGGTHTAEAMAPEALAHIGINWKQAVAGALSALVFDVVRYINLKPIPDEEPLPDEN